MKDIPKKADTTEVLEVFLYKEVKWWALHQKMNVNMHQCIDTFRSGQALHAMTPLNHTHILKMDGTLTLTPAVGRASHKAPKPLHSH